MDFSILALLEKKTAGGRAWLIRVRVWWSDYRIEFQSGLATFLAGRGDRWGLVCVGFQGQRRLRRKLIPSSWASASPMTVMSFRR